MSLRRILGLIGIALIGLGCAVEVAPAPSAEPSATRLTLRSAPAGLACDAIGVDYDLVTFRIDAAAAEHVIGMTDAGRELLTYWTAGFVPGTADDPVIREPGGEIVARDGDILPIPPAAWPRLHGHFVCPAPDALYVFLEDPA